jgi:hypothetical protein
MRAARYSHNTRRSMTFTRHNLDRTRGVYHRFIEANVIVR